MTVGEVADALRGDAVLPERPVAITFDDGYEDTFGAVECLAERELRCTIYVVLRLVDRPKRLSTQQLQDLADMPDIVALGAHSISHQPLDELTTSAMQAEVLGSKATLEQLVRRRIETFAYPYGAYNRRVRRTVIEAGFRSAVAVKNAISHPRDDPWAIARYPITNRVSPERLERLLEGKTAPRAWSRTRARTRAWRVVRRARRKLSRLTAS